MNVAGSILTESISPVAWFALWLKAAFLFEHIGDQEYKSKKKNWYFTYFRLIVIFCLTTDTFIKKQDRLEGSNIKPISVNSCINDER